MMKTIDDVKQMIGYEKQRTKMRPCTIRGRAAASASQAAASQAAGIQKSETNKNSDFPKQAFVPCFVSLTRFRSPLVPRTVTLCFVRFLPDDRSILFNPFHAPASRHRSMILFFQQYDERSAVKMA